MFKRLNLHPEGKLVGDCVKRALAKGFEKDYKEVSLELNRLKKITGATEFNEDKNWRRYVTDRGGLMLSFPAVTGEPRMNGHRFCEKFSKGRYVLRMAGHVTVVVDGILYDTFDCRDKCVYTAYKLPDAEPIQRKTRVML